ncbi:MAG: hypothetical protein U5Q44_00050 [Dehalococcoidia bacterium]|nr:hypothetical protein [Dehalococcoidia bacterium]
MPTRRYTFPHEPSCWAALDLFAENAAWISLDCLAAAHVRTRNLDGIYSYDRGFDAVGGITRREP